MWILFLIPRIEDGNNFGVSIQEEALNEVIFVFFCFAEIFRMFVFIYFSLFFPFSVYLVNIFFVNKVDMFLCK